MFVHVLLATHTGPRRYKNSIEFAEPKFGIATVELITESTISYAIPGSEVTIKTSPQAVTDDAGNKKGYEISACKVVTTNQIEVALTNVSAGVWSYIMPNCDVIITLTETQVTQCLSIDTLILSKGNILKELGDLTTQDIVMCYDFDHGCITESRLMWLPPISKSDCYFDIIMEDGFTLKMVNNHRAFCTETDRFEPIQGLLGKHVWTINGAKKVLSIKLIDKPIQYRNALSYKHMNLITNGILTSTGFNNLYPIKDMKYQKYKRPNRTNEFINAGFDIGWINGLRLYEHDTNISDARSLLIRCGNKNLLV